MGEINQIRQIDILAKTIFYEAGSTCDLREVYYIAWSIRNRVNKKWWYGKDYVSVCLKKWQYSCWNGKKLEQINKINLDGAVQWKMCQDIAEYVMNAVEEFNPFNDYKLLATHYFEPTLVSRPPKWCRSKKMIRLPNITGLKHLYFMEVK